MNGVTRTKRDPEGRRRAIVEAAATVLVAGGSANLTHRKVAAQAAVPLGSTTHYFASLDDLRAAAVDLLVTRSEEDLDELRDLLDGQDVRPEDLARYLRSYLEDTERVRADGALYAAALGDPVLRPAIARWRDGQVQILAEHLGRRAAAAVTVFMEGAAIQTLLQDEPIPFELLTAASVALSGLTDPDEASAREGDR